jgi:hypothetical protein
MLKLEQQQFVMKNGEFPIATSSIRKWVGGSPVSISGNLFNGASATELLNTVGLAAHNYDVDKEVGRATFYFAPYIFTLEKGTDESSSMKICPDPVAPYDPGTTFVAGDILIAGSETVGSDTYAVWIKATSGHYGSLMVVDTDATNTYLIVITGFFKAA